jgi:hypothetical protein
MKYENVDIVKFLGDIVDTNTESYKSDFQYDLDIFKNAALYPNGINNYLVWLSRRHGTECFTEWDIYLRESHAHTAWMYYATEQSSILAYALEIKGIMQGVIIGDIHELDYIKHVEHVKAKSRSVATVYIAYDTDVFIRVPYKEWNNNWSRLIALHGRVICLRMEPEGENEFRGILQDIRDRREKECKKTTFEMPIQVN